MSTCEFPESEISSITKREYRNWVPVRLVDPRDATVRQLIFGMRQIVEAEGPVMADRVFRLYAKAGGLGRIYESTRRRFMVALQEALKQGVFLADTEESEDLGNSVLRLPSQDRVSIRTLGKRTLHEVPAAEIAEIMLEVRIRKEFTSRDELFREVLAEYGLIRLTEASKNRLDGILLTWF